MSKSSKKKARRKRQAEQDAFLRQLNSLYGHDHLPCDVLGRRDALPSEIARQLRKGQPPRSAP